MTWLLIGIAAIGFSAPDFVVWLAGGDPWGFLWGVAAGVFACSVLAGRHILRLSWGAAFGASIAALVAIGVTMLVQLLDRDEVDPY